MRRLVVSTFLTLDGVMQGPGGPDEDRTGGFAYGGWSAPYWDDVVAQTMAAFMTPPFDVLLGRRTYDIFAAFWPKAQDETAELLNNATKYVASRTLKQSDLTWAKSRLITGDVAAEVAKLKAGDGPVIQVHGSSDLLQTLIKSDLVDEFQVLTYPVVLGKGKRLFGEGTQPRALDLIESKTSTTGVMIGKFRLAGAVKTGSFA